MQRPAHMMAAWLALAAGTAAFAQVDLNQIDVTEPLTTAEIEAALGVTGTFNIDGLAADPNGGDILIAHRDGSLNLTFARIDPVTKTASFQVSAADVATDLGSPYTASFTLVGEFIYDSGRDWLIFGDNSTGVSPPFPYSIIAIDLAATGSDPAAVEIIRSADIEGLSSFGLLPGGNLLVALAEDFTGGEPQVGIVDVNAGTYSELYDEDDFKAAVSPPLVGAEEVPPEAIAIDPVTGDAYVFCHDELLFFRITDAEGTPDLEWVDITGWSGVVDIHGLSMDSESNVYGFDEAAAAIVIWDGAGIHSLDLGDIPTELGSVDPFEPTAWRGIKARSLSASGTEVWLASSSGDYGVVRVVFGDDTTSVDNWRLYD